MQMHPLTHPLPAPLLVLATTLAAALGVAALLWLPEIDRGAPPPAAASPDTPTWTPIVLAEPRPAGA